MATNLTAAELDGYEQYFAMYRTLPVEVMHQLFATARAAADEEPKEAPAPKTRAKKGTE